MPRLKPPRRSAEETPVELLDAPTPPVGDIEIDISEDDFGPSEVDLASPPEQNEPERQPSPPPAREEPPADDALQRALDATRRAEELQRATARERDEALRREQARDQELARERSDREDAEFNSVLTAIAAEQATLDNAEAAYAAAAAVGDWATAAKAQRSIGVASARIDRLEDGKRAFETRRETGRTRQPDPQPQPRQTAPQGFEERIAALPQPAQSWLRNHPEYINDTAKNEQIGAMHNYLVKHKGVAAFSDAYFEALDTEFGFKQAAPPAPEPQPQRRSMPMVAPVSREAPNLSGQRQSPSKMTLSEEERQIARSSIVDRPDMPPLTDAQKEYLYAKNKQKYNRMKADGSYSEQQRQR